MRAARDKGVLLFVLLVFALAIGRLYCSAAPVHSATAPEEVAGAPTNPYQVDPPPLRPAQCGRCHTSQYQDLQQAGGRHQFYCQNCHEAFHAYNPRKDNYAELMPRCDQCHELPHGERFPDCRACHRNPHAPTRVPSSERLVDLCAACHSAQPAALEKYPSAHTEVGCTDCHGGAHGTIPSCLECHEPHFSEQEPSSCTGCHPAHTPLQLIFTPETGARTCGSCHEDAYTSWRRTPSRHGQVNCTLCHTQHGLIPECAECHGQPHSARLLAYYEGCLTCHQNPHNLPVKAKP